MKLVSVFMRKYLVLNAKKILFCFADDEQINMLPFPANNAV